MIDGYVQTNPDVFVTNFPAIQVVSQSGSWTVLSNQGSPNSLSNAWPVNVTDGTNILGTLSHPIQVNVDGYVRTNPDVFVTNFPSTQVISGTVTANQGTSPWVENVAQFGGSNVVTGTGASGVGIPRVTVSNDSNILTTQSGTWTVQPGNTPNTVPWLITINQGGNSATVTAANALKVDGSGVTQPVSGTVAVTQSTSPWVTDITQFGNNNVVTGTGTSGLGIPRVTVSNDSNILATQSGTWTVAQGSANTLANAWPVEITDGTNILGTISHPIQVNVDGYVQTNPNVIVTQSTPSNLLAEVGGLGVAGAPLVGNPVQIGGSDGTDTRTILTDTSGRQVVKFTASTSAQTSVAGNASSVTLLNSNAARLGSTIFNNSTVYLYLTLGATSSTSSFTVQMNPSAYYEVPFGYLGAISGIWASATGFALCTELSN